ncbi:MAG: polyprenol monophosphomannose synthase [Candidatus Bathyarchaeia archaeon]
MQASNRNRLVSVVLSTYNERDNLSRMVPVIEGILKRNKMRGEIVVVDDNSPDGTSDLVKEFGKRYGNVRLLWRPSKMGPGSAHADGYRFAKGDIIVGMDTDFSHSPYDIPRFVAKVNEGYDLVVGSRYIRGGQYEVRSFQTLRKSIASRLGNILIFLFSGVPLHDFTTALRAIRREVVDNVGTESKGNSFFMEFIIKAYWEGYRTTEIPIVFRDRVIGQSKLSLGKQSFRMLADLFRLSSKPKLSSPA